jgi:hypothetical protein
MIQSQNLKTTSLPALTCRTIIISSAAGLSPSAELKKYKTMSFLICIFVEMEDEVLTRTHSVWKGKVHLNMWRLLLRFILGKCSDQIIS